MPNWCSNEVLITGPADAVAEVVAFVGDGKNLFNKIIPMPDILHDSEAPQRDEDKAAAAITACGYPDWYSWSNANWGTKWDVDVQPDTVEPGKVMYSFSTAWSPPEPVIEELAAKFPRVSIEHFFNEEGADYSGTNFYDDGELMMTQEGSAMFYCSVCDGRAYGDELLRTEDYDFYHPGCMAATAEVLVSCNDQSVLADLAEHVVGIDLLDQISDNREVALSTLRLGYVPDDDDEQLEFWAGTDLLEVTAYLKVSHTSGGSLKLTYQTVMFDIGGSMLSLSERYPSATFYVAVSRNNDNSAPRRSVVARGQVFAVTEPPVSVT